MRTIEEIRQAIAHEAQSQANQLEGWRQRQLPALVSHHLIELDKAVQRQVSQDSFMLFYTVRIVEEPRQLRQLKAQAVCEALAQELQAAGYRTSIVKLQTIGDSGLRLRVFWDRPANDAEEDYAEEEEAADAEALAGDD